MAAMAELCRCELTSNLPSRVTDGTMSDRLLAITLQLEPMVRLRDEYGSYDIRVIEGME